MMTPNDAGDRGEEREEPEGLRGRALEYSIFRRVRINQEPILVRGNAAQSGRRSDKREDGYEQVFPCRLTNIDVSVTLIQRKVNKALIRIV